MQEIENGIAKAVVLADELRPPVRAFQAGGGIIPPHDGHDVPYVISGAVGSLHPHAMAEDVDGNALQLPWTDPTTGAVLEGFCDDRQGFLRLDATLTVLTGTYLSVPARRSPGATDRSPPSIPSPAPSPEPSDP